MALGKNRSDQQFPIWVDARDVAKSPGHPFYEQLNKILKSNGYDAHLEAACAKFYAEKIGRPSIPPGVYFRMLMIGYFEGIDSERGIAWRCKDSLALRAFLGYQITEDTPDHSSLSRTRKRIDVETHREIFSWGLSVIAKEGLLKSQTVGVDATTLEANAAMRSIVRKDTGDRYDEFLTKLAAESGIETPTREDLARFDKKRKKTTSNKDWEHPHDPDAKITKMKDGRTHMGHKAEHEVDLDTGAILAVTVQGSDKGDTTSVFETMIEGAEQISKIAEDPEVAQLINDADRQELIADKGYHSNAVLSGMNDAGIRTYISEPMGKRRNWKDKEKKEQESLYANRRRIRGNRGKSLLRSRGELVERTFAHVYDTGGMRRTHLRGHENILKRLLIHVCGFNLGLLMRKVFGFGKPRRLQEALFALLSASLMFVFMLFTRATVSEACRTIFIGFHRHDLKFCLARAEV